MNIGIRTVIETFELPYTSLVSERFSKSLRLHEWGERDLLPLVRTYLLGYFGDSLVPEAKATLPSSLSGNGRLDFIVDGVVVKLAVRKPTARRSTLSAPVDSSEVRRLMKYDGHALLVLFDLLKTPCTSEQMDAFRDLPSLGKGNHQKSPFNAAYILSRLTNQSPLMSSKNNPRPLTIIYQPAQDQLQRQIKTKI